MTQNSVKPFKVLVEASKILTPHKDGHKRYVHDLLRGLSAFAESNNRSWEFYLYLAAPGNAVIRNIGDIQDIIKEGDPFKSTIKKKAFVFGKWYGIKLMRDKLRNRFCSSEQAAAPTQRNGFKQCSFDLIHLTIPQFYQPFFNHLYFNEKSRLLTTVHDLTHLNFPEFHKKRNIEIVEKGLDAAVKRGSVFTALSQSTANDLLKTYPSIGKENVHIVYPGFDRTKFKHAADDQQAQRVKKKYRIGRAPFILSLCTLEPRKNIINTIRAFLLLKKEIPSLDSQMVIAGGKGWKYTKILNDPSLRSKDILFTGFVDEKDLPVIYSLATAFSYVSIYEGFGLPLLEAMGCGVPVIYGNNSSMPEIAEGAGLPADANDIQDIKEKYKQILTDRDLHTTLSAKAIERSERFSMDAFIHRTVRLYEKILLNTNGL